MATIARGTTRILAGLAVACALAAAGLGSHPHGGHSTALNPQPLPPGFAYGEDVVQVALNPQPLPPRFAYGEDVVQVALNPQPEPPGRRGVPRFLPPGPCRRSAVVA